MDGRARLCVQPLDDGPALRLACARDMARPVLVIMLR